MEVILASMLIFSWQWKFHSLAGLLGMVISCAISKVQIGPKHLMCITYNASQIIKSGTQYNGSMVYFLCPSAFQLYKQPLRYEIEMKCSGSHLPCWLRKYLVLYFPVWLWTEVVCKTNPFLTKWNTHFSINLYNATSPYLFRAYVFPLLFNQHLVHHHSKWQCWQ